jgi:hypothetical protein
LEPLPTVSFATVNQRDAPCGLYARLLGSSWLQVAEPVRFAHASESTVRAHGRLRIAHGHSHVARLLARLLRLPRASDAAETWLVVTSGVNGEQWLRTFDDRRLDTRQYQAGNCELAERIGALEFRLRLEVSEGSLLFRQLEAAFCVARSGCGYLPRGRRVSKVAKIQRAHIQYASTSASRSRRLDLC